MKLYSDAIEYYGAQDDNEMCIDLNMRMQSILVRPYILDALCEHESVPKNEQEAFYDKLAESDHGIKTNFEQDNRRTNNPYAPSKSNEFPEPILVKEAVPVQKEAEIK